MGTVVNAGFVARCLYAFVVACKESEHAERLWCHVHRGDGSIAICNWYLPPGASLVEIDFFNEELEEISQVADSISVCRE